MTHWAQDAVFYHLFPLGSTGAPPRNDFVSPPSGRLNDLHAWLPYLQDLGVNALLLGPMLEASAHGYDTADLYTNGRSEEVLGKLFCRARASRRPFCWGLPGLMRSRLMPRRSHQTDSRLKPNSALDDANGVPLSVRMASGSPYSLNTRSKTVNANVDCTDSKPSQASRKREL